VHRALVHGPSANAAPKAAHNRRKKHPPLSYAADD
jgi:hypothetical protein